MARYSGFLGLQVEVQYRAGDILLPASGTLVGDTGRSVFLEQVFEQLGRHRSFRWEIPYPCIVRLTKRMEVCGQPIRSGPPRGMGTTNSPAGDDRETEMAEAPSERASYAAAGVKSRA